MRTLVVYGNCQAAAIATTLQQVPEIAKIFEVKHHFVSATTADLEPWSGHISRAGAIIVQNVSNWSSYPFRDRLPADIIRIDIPFIYLGSLWPFDCTQNPDDIFAQQLRGQRHDWDFAYQDTVLGRLRTEIPNPSARFSAYVGMNYSDAINIKRYHEFESMRLRALDKKFGLQLGTFILDRFRSERLFHSITHPSPVLMKMLVVEMLSKLGVVYNFTNVKIDDIFSYYQVPLHPVVIRDLGIEWANETTRYQFYDRELTFDEYIMKYIEVYG